METLTSLLKINKTIKHYDFRYNGFYEDGGIELKKALEEAKHVLSFKTFERMSKPTFKELLEEVKTHKPKRKKKKPKKKKKK